MGLATIAVVMTLAAEAYKAGLEGAEDQAKKTSGNIGNTLANIGKGIVFAGAAIITGGLVALGKGLESSIVQAADAASIQADLEATLKSTGGAAGMTAEAINALGTQFGNATLFEDDVVVKGEAMLLTFTNIGKDVFPMATEAMLNMSQKMGTDLQGSAIQLGKALNDPTAGISALTRVGVTFSDSQKAVIKSLQDSGDMAGAQNIILQELQKEFGGAAEAAGAAGSGPLVIFQHAIGNIMESIGTGLLPIIGKLATQVSDWISSPAVQTGIAQFAGGIASVANFLGMILGDLLNGGIGVAFDDIRESLVGLVPQFVLDAMGWLYDCIAAFVNLLQTNQGVVVAILAAMGTAVATFVFTTVIPAIAAMLVAMAPIILIMAAIGAVAYVLYTAWTNDWGGIREKTEAVVNWIKTAIHDFLAFVQGLWSAHGTQVTSTVSGIWNGIVSVVTSVIAWIQTAVSTFMALIQSWWDAHGAAIMAIVNTFWQGILTIWNDFVTIIQDVVKLFLDVIHGHWYQAGEDLRKLVGDIWQTIEDLFTVAWTNIQLIVTNMWAAIKFVFTNAWTAIKAIVSNLITDVINFFTTTDWSAVGTGIINGIKNGIMNAAQGLINAAVNAAKAALDAVKGFLGISSPSTVFAGIGENMMQGWAQGINSNANLPTNAAVSAAGNVTGGATTNITVNPHYYRGDEPTLLQELSTLGSFVRAY